MATVPTKAPDPAVALALAPVVVVVVRGEAAELEANGGGVVEVDAGVWGWAGVVDDEMSVVTVSDVGAADAGCPAAVGAPWRGEPPQAAATEPKASSTSRSRTPGS